MKQSVVLILTAFIAFGLMARGSLRADLIGVDLAGDGYVPLGLNGTWGYEFELSDSATVTGLGFWDSGDGYTRAQVGLWDTSGQLLLDVDTVTGGVSTFATANGHGEWNFLDAAIGLDPGRYIVGAWGDGVEATVDLSDATSALKTSVLTFIVPRYRLGTSFQFPSSSESDSFAGYFGGNVRFAGQVPEPSSLALFALVFLTLTSIVRRRGRAK